MSLFLPLARGYMLYPVLPDVDCAQLCTPQVADHLSRLEDVTDVRYLALRENGEILLPTRPLTRDEAECWAADSLRILSGGVSAEGVLHLVLVMPEGYEAPRAHAEESQWQLLRTHAHLLDDDSCAAFIRAHALSNWHRSLKFCSKCGGQMRMGDWGATSQCASCQTVEYPRQDPAVIVLLTDDEDRIILAHNRPWRPRFRSLLAGFAEAGESPERTVVREVWEESGLRARDVRYIATQPWPFPRSTMLAFSARCETAPPQPDMVEVDEVKAWSRRDLIAAVRSGELELPGPTAIARSLIEMWLGEEIPDDAHAGVFHRP